MDGGRASSGLPYRIGAMSSRLAFNTQLASIMEVLANAAVAQISKLVEEGYAALQLEVCRSRREKEALRRKVQTLEARRRCPECGLSPAAERGRELRVSAFVPPAGEERFAGLWRDAEEAEELRVMLEDGGEQTEDSIDEKPASLCVKEERPDGELGNRAQRGEVQLTGDRLVEVSDRNKNVPGALTRTVATKSRDEPAKHNRKRNNAWKASNAVLKEEPQNDTASQQTESKHEAGTLSNLDYMMYESTGELDTFSSQGNTEEDTRGPTCNYVVEPENLALCSESQPTTAAAKVGPFSEWDKMAMLMHTQHNFYREEDNRDEFSVGEMSMLPPNAQMTMGENVPSKSDDRLVMPRNIRNHRRVPPRGKLFICTYCGKGLACLKNLKTHQRVHTGEKPFSCTQCGKRFADSSNFKRHLSVHTGERRYSCTYCGKRFGQSGSLKVHLRVHTGQRHFSCLHCGKSFISSSHLKRHQNVHVGESGH